MGKGGTSRHASYQDVQNRNADGDVRPGFSRREASLLTSSSLHAADDSAAPYHTLNTKWNPNPRPYQVVRPFQPALFRDAASVLRGRALSSTS